MEKTITILMKKDYRSAKFLKHWFWGGLIMLISFTSSLSAVTPNLNVSANLVTPNPTPEAKSLYQFLKDNYGNKIISGVSEMSEVNWLKSNTGKEPALVGLDFMHTNRGYTWYDNNEPGNQAKAWYNRNGIPTIYWHWKDPSRKTESFYTAGTSFDVSKIWDVNSAEYKAMISDIDFAAGLLKQLQDAGVPVLWRPLHEAGGTWFWWGAKGGGACVQLWRVMYDRLVNYHGLKNLIWVWTGAPNEKNSYYPGDAYVDIVGRDYYNTGDHSSGITENIDLYNTYPSKLATITECGSFPDPDNLTKDKAYWSWFMVWYGDFVRSSTYNSLDLWKKAFNSNNVITLDKMPYLRTYGACAATAITPNIQVNGGTWAQIGTVTVVSGTKVVLGPQPSTGGSWNWNGGCGTSGTSREQTIYPTGDCDILATYTNSCGTQSFYTFQIRITSPAIVSGATYSIIARNSGKALDVSGAGTTNGTNVQQWTYSGNANQQWIITSLGGGYYRLSPAHATGQALDVTGSGTGDGTNVETWSYGGGYNQQWQLVANGSYYNIVDRNSGKYLDVSAGSTADGGNVQILTGGSTNYNQQWTLTKLNVPLKVRAIQTDITPDSNSNIETRIYPNPSNGSFTVECAQAGLLQIFDHNGKLLLTQKLVSTTTEVDSKLSSGAYVVRITGKDKLATLKLIVAQ